MPFISVVVLTYNRKESLRHCLLSLFNQSCDKDEFEIIVVDDGSNDGTNLLIEELRNENSCLKYVYQKNSGVGAARNVGIQNSKGNLIAFLADDYILPSNYLNTIKQFFLDYPKAFVVRFKIIGSDDSLIARAAQLYYEVDFMVRSGGYHFPERNIFMKLLRYFKKTPKNVEKVVALDIEAAGAAAFKKELFALVGQFDPNLRRAEDSDMTARIISRGEKIYYFPFLGIIHKHSPHFKDHFKKFYRTGFHRFFYQKRYPLPFSFLTRLKFRAVNLLLFPFWVARQTNNTIDFVLCLPIIYLLQITLYFGFYFAAFIDFFKLKKP